MRDMATSPPNSLGAHVHRLQHIRLMAPNCTPQPDICIPFWCPQLQVKGCHVGRDGHLQSLGHSWGGSFWCQFNPSNCQSRGFWFDSFRLLRGQLRSGGGGSMTALFGWGWGWRIWGNMIQLPSKDHTDHPPPILLLLTQFSVVPPSPTATLPPATN